MPVVSSVLTSATFASSQKFLMYVLLYKFMMEDNKPNCRFLK